MTGERTAMQMGKLLALALVLGVWWTASVAGADRYALDRVHTQILFFVDHLGFSKSQGEFRDFDGHFVFDPQDWSRSSVAVQVRTASIDMDDYEWDKHLRGKDFFDVAQHPEMTFRSLRVERTGDSEGVIHGELSLLGESRPVALHFTFNKQGVHPISKQYVAGFSAHGVIRRSEFGMQYGIPMVSDEVQVRLEVEGFRQPE